MIRNRTILIGVLAALGLGALAACNPSDVASNNLSRGTDQEVAYVLKQFGLFAFYELNVKSPHQNRVRSFHVRGQAQ